jgi:hypothetical protein
VLALVAAVVSVVLAIPLILYSGRGGELYSRETPWPLTDASQRQVIIAGGLAGFAVTGMVLLVTLARDRADVQTDSFNATVFMFLTAYLFFVSAAFLFAFMPKADPDGTPPEIQFALAANLQFRSVMIAWFALRPLMQTFGLPTLADLVGGAITFSLYLGGTFLIAILYGIGVITLRQAILLPIVAGVAWGMTAVLANWFIPELQSGRSALYLTAGIYGLNVLTFLHFSIGLLANVIDRVDQLSRAYSRKACLIDIQSTMIMVAFLWMAIMGIV